MQRISILLLVLVVSFATALQAQAPAPKPDPALKKLQVLVGHWMYQGEYKPGPLGPGGKITGEYSGRMILGGFFYQDQETEKGAMGETHSQSTYGYDPVNKNFTWNGYQSDGSTYSGIVTVSGNTWTWTGNFFTGGKQYPMRAPFTLAPDLMSGTEKVEISVDGGKTWTPFFEANWTKVQPAPKK